MTILVAENDAKVYNFIGKGLITEHYTVEFAYDGREALEKAEINNYDLIIMDVTLPDKDGVEVVKRLRAAKIEAPVIMLTDGNQVDVRIRCLNAGADDCLGKPFAFGELLARIRALLRRERIVKTVPLRVGDLELDPATRAVRRGGREYRLTKREYRLLNYLMRRPGMVCTRTMIGEHIWGYGFTQRPMSIEVFINRLRKKLDRGFRSKLIYTVRDVGYKIQDKSGKKLTPTAPGS